MTAITKRKKQTGYNPELILH